MSKERYEVTVAGTTFTYYGKVRVRPFTTDAGRTYAVVETETNEEEPMGYRFVPVRTKVAMDRESLDEVIDALTRVRDAVSKRSVRVGY